MKGPLKFIFDALGCLVLSRAFSREWGNGLWRRLLGLYMLVQGLLEECHRRIRALESTVAGYDVW